MNDVNCWIWSESWDRVGLSIQMLALTVWPQPTLPWSICLSTTGDKDSSQRHAREGVEWMNALGEFMKRGIASLFLCEMRLLSWDLYCYLLRWLLWEGMCLGSGCGFRVAATQSSFSSLNSQLWNEKSKKSFRILSFGIPRPLTICWTSFSNIPSFSHEVKVQETHKRLPCNYN